MLETWHADVGPTRSCRAHAITVKDKQKII